ncbi:hypothetical protein OOK60_18210 [Trichothermofontia sichuanensis B231]|uniref:hypothetical protein n=1 Tax=Trichothermofontia sichuanensis TaxID=3045816 RepID=UPI002247D58F|nr:hypothetical protein [Trichothermofontia sichuanensis]UZQ54379.1 hypothetical protein OOK60_18210 [Trichothermofontia sichuanensis B231]
MVQSHRQIWLNFLALLPGTALTVLTIAVAFLRFYDEQDFHFLQLVTHPRAWSNRLTVAALLVALANFGVEWHSRNREADRRIAEEQRRVAEQEQAARRAAIETERDLALLTFLVEPSDDNCRKLVQVLAVLQEYRDTLA